MIYGGYILILTIPCPPSLLCHLSKVLQAVIKCLLRMPVNHMGIDHYTKWEAMHLIHLFLVRQIFYYCTLLK
ncbi:hypothetical protein E2C01_006448 [Portunus trituberculatus]|uniref:Uncharacterized protein n=1 Tax=Portunus trituberculatus TaxID=210409 RepID=A0A5B7CXD6_PORTR|nr:hypothetical protein [Portunus trituberculatus]